MSHPDVPEHIEAVLQAQEPEVLREVARRAQEIADAKIVQELAEPEDKKPLDEHEDELDEYDRDEAPAGATLTTKEINDNRYYYWQWREGDKVKSEYVKPVNPDE